MRIFFPYISAFLAKETLKCPESILKLNNRIRFSALEVMKIDRSINKEARIILK